MLPSANALFVFEAVARLRSFTRAAGELNVTQPAISRTIGAFERDLGAILFRRGGRQLGLTESGEILHGAVKSSFSAIKDALDDITLRISGQETVSLSISTAMASHWLIPRIDDFRQEFPNTELRFDLISGEPTGPVSPSDLGLRLDDHADTEHVRWPFAPERIYAVGSSDYLARSGQLQSPKEGQIHTLIQLTKPRLTWHEFADRVGAKLPRRHNSVVVSDYSVVLQSAVNGKGLALAFISSASKLICDRLLIPATPRSLDTGRRYHLVASNRQRLRPIVERVRDWMISQMEQDLAELRDL